jgi:hypothetical protein
MNSLKSVPEDRFGQVGFSENDRSGLLDLESPGIPGWEVHLGIEPFLGLEVSSEFGGPWWIGERSKRF